MTACATRERSAQLVSPTSPVAVAATLELEPLDLSPDGEMRLLVRLHYSAADGKRAHIPPGGHVDVSASRGTVQWQPRAQYGDPAAIVRLTEAGPLQLRVRSDIPRVAHLLTAATDTRAWRLPAVTARAVGPHSVEIGWFPRVDVGQVRITRVAPDGTRRAVIVLAPASSFRDTAVTPGAQYTYEVRRPRAGRIEIGVGMPRELPHAPIAVIRGKAMWLSFDDVRGWNVEAMLARAQTAGIRAVELRLTYGEYFQITPARRATLDRFIDGAAQRGIAILGWTVPRALHYEDLAANVAAAGYSTARGNGVSGLAVDLERGADFLVGPPAVLAAYVSRLREAIGPRVLLVATVEDPYLEYLGGAVIPYAAIAAHADVLQPMTYWRTRAAGASIAGMRAVLEQSYRTLQQRVKRPIAIDIGGQTANLGTPAGAPPPPEVRASIATAHDLGAIGETFFDWDATSPEQWAAIAAAPWAAVHDR